MSSRVASVGGLLLLLVSTAAARPLEYYTRWIGPDDKERVVAFTGSIERGLVAGTITVDAETFDVDGSFERNGRVFVAVSRPGGRAVATFDGQSVEGRGVEGTLTRQGDGWILPLTIPARLKTEDAR